MKKVIIFTIALFFSVFANAQSWNIGTNITVTLHNEALTISGTYGMSNVRTTCNGCVVNTPWFPDHTAEIKRAVVEEGVTGIADFTFYGLNQLTSISIPNGITHIGSTFAGYTSSLTSIVNYSPVPLQTTYITNGAAFQNLNMSQVTLTVPCGSLAAYQNALGWKDFGDIVEDCPPGVYNVKSSFACPGGVSVTYDLIATSATDITLYYSPDNGKTWLKAQTVSGQLTSQTSGTGKTIFWDNIADNVSFGQLRLKVEAEPEFDCVMINNTCWATRNVDAPGTFTNNPEDLGMLYKWNSAIGWSTTNPMVNSNGETIWNGSYPATGVTTWETANNVCPKGYRVPTESELRSLIDSDRQWTTINGVNGLVLGSDNNTIFLPAAGIRHASGGSLEDVGSYGHYCSSTRESDASGYELEISKFNAYVGARTNWGLIYARSVRCVKQ